jgi:glycosyltransferase involved in cell wall biosynthesis
LPDRTLSLLIVARNEAGRIGDCIRSGQGAADETVVVLDRSDDDTVQIAERMGARVVSGAWPDEGERRTAAIAACTGDWVLELDADERVSAALAAELPRAIASDAADYYIVPFHNHVGGRWVRHGWGAYNGVAAKGLLFRKGAKQWKGGTVHPAIAFTGRRGQLAGHIDHYVDDDFTAMFDRLNRYATAAAADALARGEMPGALSTLRRFFSRFLKSYVQRRGYREGRFGVALGLFSALYPVLTHLKMLEARDRAD